MADLISHIQQAKHNKDCAAHFFEDNPSNRDWAITAAFYSAVHYIEACFTSIQEIGHTEDACGNQEKHGFRTRMVRKHYPVAWKSYRKLQDASYIVRYIVKDIPGKQRFSLAYYTADDAEKMLTTELENIISNLQKGSGINLS